MEKKKNFSRRFLFFRKVYVYLFSFDITVDVGDTLDYRPSLFSQTPNSILVPVTRVMGSVHVNVHPVPHSSPPFSTVGQTDRDLPRPLKRTSPCQSQDSLSKSSKFSSRLIKGQWRPTRPIPLFVKPRRIVHGPYQSPRLLSHYGEFFSFRTCLPLIPFGEVL